MPLPSPRLPMQLRHLEARATVDLDKAARCQRLISDLSSVIRFDTAQRSAQVTDAQAAKAAFQQFGSATAGADAQALKLLLSTGIAPISTAEGQILFPVGSLARPDVVPVLTSGIWAGLGLGGRADTVTLTRRLVSDFPRALDLFTEDGVKAMSGQASRTRRQEKPRAGEGGPDPDTPRTGNGGTLPSGSGAIQDALLQVLALAKDLGDALLRAQWSVDAFYIHISLDRAGADAIQKVLIGNAEGYLAGVARQVVDNILPALAAGSLAKASIPWVGLALLHFSAYWGVLIALNKGPNGAVLHHLMPWWVPLSAGIYSGYVSAK